MLVAIAIPIFTSQLEKSRQATDLANIRAAYAEASVNALDNNSDGTEETIPMVHKDAGFTKNQDARIGEIAVKDNDYLKSTCTENDVVVVTVNASTGAVTIAKKN